jgi:tetratricopeptide (TPR) repeat protein
MNARCSILLIVMTAILCVRTFAAHSLSSQFEAANKLYDQGKFNEAAESYSKLLESGSASSAIYFNLGNASFKSSQLGRAIAAYRQALELAPRDADIRANLQFARNQVQGPTLKPRVWESWLSGLTINEWTLLTASALWIWFGLLASVRLWPNLRPALRSCTFAVGIVTLLLTACLATVLHTRSNETAIVIARDTTVHNGPLDESPTAFKANDGAELQVLDRRTGWLQVSAGPTRTGWIRQNETVSSSLSSKIFSVKSPEKL